MPKRSKKPPLAEDTDRNLFPFPCPKCGEKIIKPGRWFKERDEFVCPFCRHNIFLDEDQRLRFFSEHIQHINNLGLVKRIK